MLRHLINLFLWPLPPSRFFLFRRILLRASKIHIGKRVCICGRSWIYGRGNFDVGDDTWISPGLTIYTHLEATISIGKSCDVGPDVEFVTGGHLIGDNRRRAAEGIAQSISVGDGSWIGARSLILGGVSIGSGAIVAAGSVVTKDIPSNALAAGVPAVVKRIIS